MPPAGTATSARRRGAIPRLYEALLGAYGRQGWWPLSSRAGTPGFDERGYHRGRGVPRTPAERFEIVLGAVLTQNTAWTNAEKALARLRSAGVVMPAQVLGLRIEELAELVRPAGYYNQKARKLQAIAMLFSRPAALSGKGHPTREDLLSVWGIGNETADSILLYVFHQPVFVVDAYTRRLLERLGIAGGALTYMEVQALFHEALPRDSGLFGEMHALIVEHAKRRCRASPLCGGCPVTFCRLARP